MADEIKKADEQKPVKDDKKLAKKKEKKPGLWTKIKKFFKEVKSEITKVVWPTPKQVLNNTVVVIVIVLLSAVFIGAVDALFKFLIGLIV